MNRVYVLHRQLSVRRVNSTKGSLRYQPKLGPMGPRSKIGTCDRLQDLGMQYVISFYRFLGSHQMYYLAFRGVEPHIPPGLQRRQNVETFCSVVLSSSLSIVRYNAVSSANSRTWEQTSHAVQGLHTHPDVVGIKQLYHVSPRPSSAVRPVRLWPDHFFLPKMVLVGPHFWPNMFFAGPFSHVSSRPSLMIYYSLIKD